MAIDCHSGDGHLLVFLPEQEVPAQLDCSSRLEGQRDVRRMGQYVGDSLKIRNPAGKSSPQDGLSPRIGARTER